MITARNVTFITATTSKRVSERKRPERCGKIPKAHPRRKQLHRQASGECSQLSRSRTIRFIYSPVLSRALVFTAQRWPVELRLSTPASVKQRCCHCRATSVPNSHPDPIFDLPARAWRTKERRRGKWNITSGAHGDHATKRSPRS